MTFPKTIADFLKLAPKILLGVSFGSAFVLFAPDSLEQKLGILAIRDGYRPWIGILFILSVALCLSHLIFNFAPLTKERFIQWRIRRLAVERLHSLTQEEQNILSRYIANKSRVHHFDIADGNVAELDSLGIIARSSSVARVERRFDYNIKPWAWDYLNAHPELVGLPNAIPINAKKSADKVQ
jgi:hypothetical protein